MPYAPLVFAVLLFPATLLCLEVGYRLRARGFGDGDGDGSVPTGFSVIDGSVFSLLGLLLAFSFSAAGGRFEQRKQLVASEAAAIREVYLRVDVLPDEARDRLHAMLANYTKVRKSYNDSLGSHPDPVKLYETTVAEQEKMWQITMDSMRQKDLAAEMRLVVPAVITMFRAAGDRQVAVMSREPALIYGLLAVLSLLSGVLAGRLLSGERRTQRAHRLIFAGVIASTVFVICDLDNPRVGTIRVDYADRLFDDVLSGRR